MEAKRSQSGRKKQKERGNERMNVGGIRALSRELWEEDCNSFELKWKRTERMGERETRTREKFASINERERERESEKLMKNQLSLNLIHFGSVQLYLLGRVN